ncbi:MAG: hypothetical protein HYX27_08235 [Acidobacteria bacterium]|nr:hypothetical protein [Acidobacteriota bacterium]
MPRCQRVIFVLFALSLPAAILPEGIELHSRKTVTALKPEPAAVWSEYGLQEAESAEYSGLKGSFFVSVWRLPDATNAQAALQLLRAARPAGSLQQRGNYVLEFSGFKPEEETINQLILHMPRYDSSSLPALTGFLPAPNRHGNSERYIVGPASLEAFLPGMSPSLVAFHFGTEGQLARYRDKDGDVTLVLFNYPNPQIAKERLAAFQEHKQYVARRSGPLLAVVTQSPTPDAAERMLSQVRWEVNVTLNQQLPDPKGDNIGVLFLNVSKFSGLMIVFAVFAGGAFAGFRMLGRKFSGQKPGEDATVIALHIDE